MFPHTTFSFYFINTVLSKFVLFIDNYNHNYFHFFFSDGPDSLKIEPYKKKVNITEGDRLGPFTCTADCNPQCVIKWNNKTDEGLGTQSHKSILSIKNIKRINSGTYYCNAVHTKDITRYKEKDMVVNVHCEYINQLVSFFIRYIDTHVKYM